MFLRSVRVEGRRWPAALLFAKGVLGICLALFNTHDLYKKKCSHMYLEKKSTQFRLVQRRMMMIPSCLYFEKQFLFVLFDPKKNRFASKRRDAFHSFIDTNFHLLLMCYHNCLYSIVWLVIQFDLVSLRWIIAVRAEIRRKWQNWKL